MKPKLILKKRFIFLTCFLLIISVTSMVHSAGPTLSLSNYGVPVNGALNITVSNAQNPTNPKDWIGLYENNVTPGSQEAIWWCYLPELGITSGNGTFTFNPANIPAAKLSRYTAGQTYKFILAYNDSFTVATSVSYTASAAQSAGVPTLSLSNSSVPVNGAVDVTVYYAQNPTLKKDWIGLYEDSVVPGGQVAIWWSYLLDLGVTGGNGVFTFNPANIAADQKSRYTAGKTYKFILAYNDTFVVVASGRFNTTTSQTPAIISFNQVMVNTNAGTAPTLPVTVMAKYSDGTVKGVNVTWNTIAPSQYAQAGSFTVKGLVSSTGVVPKASVTVLEETGPVMRFAVISDVHIRSSSSTDVYSMHFMSALNDMNQILPSSSSNALVFVGDFTDGGAVAQYDAFNTMLNSVQHGTPYFVLGNHEIFNYSDYNTAKTNFLTKTGMPGVYYDKLINGYHFIFLGSESINGNSIYLSTTQLQWLQQKLSENAASNKPVFVFMHQPLSNTVAGSDAMKDVTQDSQVKSILAQYPQAVLMTGHTHYVTTSPNGFYSLNYCNMVNTASVGYLWYGPTDSQPGNGSQGLYIDVYSNKVVIKGREFTRQEWLAQKTFLYGITGIVTNKINFGKGEPINVNFCNGPGNAKDWIGIFKSTDTPGVQPATLWLYVNGTQSAATGLKTGNITFPTGLLTAGTYKAGFFANDGFTRICNDVSFTVGP